LNRDKVLIVIRDGPDQGAHSVTVQAATADLTFVVVDHRQNSLRQVDVGTCDKVASTQDFAEAVFDEIAAYIQYNRELIEKAHRLSDLLSQ
jgi:hypothetical protein